jgi:hypothetical protein
MRPPADTAATAALRVGRIALHDVQLDAYVSPDSAVQLRSITFEGRNLVLGSEPRLTIDALNAAVAPPGTTTYFAVSTRGALTPEQLRLDPIRVQTERTEVVGLAVVPRDFDDPRQLSRLLVELKAQPLALADLAAVVPAVRPEGEVTFEARAEGEGHLVTTALAARLEESSLTADARIPIARGRPAGYGVRVNVAGLDPSAILRSGPAGNLSGTVRADLRGATPRESEGTITLRLSGSRVGGTALQQLEVDATLSRGRADLTASADLPAGEFEARGWARPFDSIPTYRLTGRAGRLPGGDALARALATGEADPALDVRFTVRGSGVAPATARASGRVDLFAVRPGADLLPLSRRPSPRPARSPGGRGAGSRGRHRAPR